MPSRVRCCKKAHEFAARSDQGSECKVVEWQRKAARFPPGADLNARIPTSQSPTQSNMGALLLHAPWVSGTCAVGPSINRRALRVLAWDHAPVRRPEGGGVHGTCWTRHRRRDAQLGLRNSHPCCCNLPWVPVFCLPRRGDVKGPAMAS